VPPRPGAQARDMAWASARSLDLYGHADRIRDSSTARRLVTGTGPSELRVRKRPGNDSRAGDRGTGVSMRARDCQAWDREAGNLAPPARSGCHRPSRAVGPAWSSKRRGAAPGEMAAPRCRQPPAQVPWLASCQEEDVMTAYKVIEVIGASGNSWEDAAAEAIRAAGATLHDLRVAEVVKQDIHLEEGGAITYRTKLELSFKYEHGQ